MNPESFGLNPHRAVHNKEGRLVIVGGVEGDENVGHEQHVHRQVQHPQHVPAFRKMMQGYLEKGIQTPMARGRTT